MSAPVAAKAAAKSAIAGVLPLHTAVLDSRPSLVSALLELRGNSAECDAKGRTALHVATQNGRWLCVLALLASDRSPATRTIDCNAVDVDGRTPLALGAMANSLSIPMIQSLLANGADVNRGDADGMTPLHWFALHDNVRAARELIGHQAWLHLKTVDGHTPLDLATDPAMRGLLLAVGERESFDTVKPRVRFAP